MTHLHLKRCGRTAAAIFSHCLLVMFILPSSAQAAATDLIDTWRLETSTQTSVYLDAQLIAQSAKISGKEFLSFNKDQSVTGTEWLLGNYLEGLEQTSTDGRSSNFPTADATSLAYTQWKQQRDQYRIVYKLAGLQLDFINRSYPTPIHNSIRMVSAWMNRNVLSAQSNPVAIPYVYRYSHSGRFSKDKSKITGSITIIVIEQLTAGSAKPRVFYVKSQYRGSRFPVKSDCCNVADTGANAAASDTFLAAIGEQQGVETTASGLKYLVLQEGTDTSPRAASDSGFIGFRGFLPNGSTVESGVRYINPISSDALPWRKEALQLMRGNGKYRFFVPSNLAYGATGNGKIGPDAAVIYDVELYNP